MRSFYRGYNVKVLIGEIQGEDGLIKRAHLFFKGFSILFAYSETPWYTRGKKRIIPVWWNENGFFIYKIGIAARKLKRKGGI